MTPLRVAVLSRAVAGLHGHGGLERHVADLVRHLDARGAQVTLITRRPHGAAPAVTAAAAGTARTDWSLQLGQRTRVLMVPYLTFPFAGRRGTTVLDRSTAYPLFGLRAGRRAAGLVQAGEIDWVYGLGASALGYAHRRRRGAASAPFIFNPQGLEEFGGPDGTYGGSPLKGLGYIPLQAAVRTCASAADRVIATDRVLVPLVERHLHVPSSRLVVVPNAIDLDMCDRLAGPADGESIRRRHGLDLAEPLLLSVGRVEQNKGLHVLASALGRLTGTPWRWVHVGEGPNRPTLERAIDVGRIGDRVILAGRTTDHDLHAWYEAATLFVHPTLYEGSSLVTLEAMAHRRAVVATEAGGLPDKVRPGTTGWLVPPGDAAALAMALARALERPADLPAMGRAGRELAERDFAWPVVADRLLDIGAALVGR